MNWHLPNKLVGNVTFQDQMDLVSKLSGISRKKMGCVEKVKTNRNSVFSGLNELDRAFLLTAFGVCYTPASNNFPSLPPTIHLTPLFGEMVKTLGDESGISHLLGSQVNSCLGAYLGMVLGDYLGAPIEFLNAQNNCNAIVFTRDIIDKNDDADNSSGGGVLYPSERSDVFRLELGQWTDDASMGACLADSLLVCRQFSGSVGYNNAFTFSTSPTPRDPYRSVGLGGNISKSINACTGLSHSQLPPRMLSAVPDAGNGALMRLAAVPVFFSHDPVRQAMEIARLSSETTHPGAIASRAAEFMAFVIHCAINRHNRRDPDLDLDPASPARSDGDLDETETAAQFLTRIVALFLTEYIDMSMEGSDELCRLLRSKEDQHSTELCWNWKLPRLDIERCMLNRGDKYNGYPNSYAYFGS